MRNKPPVVTFFDPEPLSTIACIRDGPDEREHYRQDFIRRQETLLIQEFQKDELRQTCIEFGHDPDKYLNLLLNLIHPERCGSWFLDVIARMFGRIDRKWASRLPGKFLAFFRDLINLRPTIRHNPQHKGCSLQEHHQKLWDKHFALLSKCNTKANGNGSCRS